MKHFEVECSFQIALFQDSNLKCDNQYTVSLQHKATFHCTSTADSYNIYSVRSEINFLINYLWHNG